jgi:hypothetical protein
MKLRIKGDSVRLRLTQGEVRALADQGSVADAVNFSPESRLEYRVRRAPVATLTAHYDSSAIEVCVPDEMALEWAASDLVTLEYTRHTPEGDLRLIIEKDFTCLVPRAGEDESDHFPHPKAPAGA